MEKGESSAPKHPEDEEVWAKLIPADSQYSEIKLSLNEAVICSEMTNPSSGTKEWCKITRNVDQLSAVMQNRSSKAIFVDGTVVQDEHATVIKCGSEISLGPNDEGFLKYRFEMMPTEESRRFVKDILLADPSLKLSSEDIALLNSCSSIKSPLVLRKKRSRRKREHSRSDAGNSWEPLCPQCGSEFGGYQCNESTVHLQCQACRGMMPSRLNIGLQQHCLGCDRAFCAAYRRSQGVDGSNLHLFCSPETFKPIAERTITRIPSLAHENNQFEQSITERCIGQTGKSLQEVIADWILKFDNREIDRTRMPLNHAEMITSGTHTCSECYDKFVSFLLYWFRISMTRLVLPIEAAEREDCWYGEACRTQHHNQEHARQRNHVCRPIRGTQFRF